MNTKHNAELIQALAAALPHLHNTPHFDKAAQRIIELSYTPVPITMMNQTTINTAPTETPQPTPKPQDQQDDQVPLYLSELLRKHLGREPERKEIFSLTSKARAAITRGANIQRDKAPCGRWIYHPNSFDTLIQLFNTETKAKKENAESVEGALSIREFLAEKMSTHPRQVSPDATRSFCQFVRGHQSSNLLNSRIDNRATHKYPPAAFPELNELYSVWLRTYRGAWTQPSPPKPNGIQLKQQFTLN